MSAAQDSITLSKSAKKRANAKARAVAGEEEKVVEEVAPPAPKAKPKAKAEAKKEEPKAPKADAKAEPKAKVTDAKAKPKAKAEAKKEEPKAEAKAKEEPKVKAEAKAKAEPKAKGKAKAAKPEVAEAKAPAPKKEEDPFLRLDDGTGDDWEVATKVSKKDAKRNERILQEKEQAAAQSKAAQAVQLSQNIPGYSPVAETKKAKGDAKAAPAPAPVSAAAAVAAKDAAPEAPKDVATVNISVPEEKIGRLIGPKGANLKLITEKTGLTRIDTAGGMFTLTGPQKAVDAAELAVKELVEKGYMSLAYDNFSEGSALVHPSVFPDLIGKGGVIIRAMKDTLGCEVSIPQVPANSQKNKKFKVGLAGSKEAVEQAKAVIEDIVMYYHHEVTHPGQVHEEFEVPDWMYRFIIGSKGSEMRHIQNSFKVRVYIPRETSTNQNVVVVGEKADVVKAKAYIDKIMWNAEHQPQGRDKQEGAEDHWGEDGEKEPWMDQYLYKRS